MRAVFTIGWKDFKSLATTPMFYLIAAFCTTLWSFTYLRNLFLFAERSFMGGKGLTLQMTVFLQHISQINLLFIFVIPALTMRLIAEEKKTRTYDLLLTAPITATQISLGKFLAGFLAAFSLILISFLYPLFTLTLAHYSIAPLLTAYLGLILVAAAYVAVGVFASSLTESVVLAVVMGLVFNLALWFVSQGAQTTANPILSAVLQHLSIGEHFLSFIRGSIRVKSLVFLLSCVGLFVFLTQRVVESSRWR